MEEKSSLWGRQVVATVSELKATNRNVSRREAKPCSMSCQGAEHLAAKSKLK